MNKSEIRKKILKIRSQNSSMNNQIDFNYLYKTLKELKSLIYEYRDKKEGEINKLNEDHFKLKNEIEINQKNYEKLLDEAADEISNFVEKANLESLS